MKFRGLKEVGILIDEIKELKGNEVIATRRIKELKKELEDVRRELEGYKKKEVKWLQSILDTKHIEENSRWIIEGRLRNLKEVKSK